MIALFFLGILGALWAAIFEGIRLDARYEEGREAYRS